MKYSSFSLPIALWIAIASYACKTVDLRSDYLQKNAQTHSLEERGRQLLEEAGRQMGYDQLSQTEAYEVTANFKWNPFFAMMPMNALPGNLGKDIQFRFATNTFDGQVAYLEGRKENKTYGLQSWEGYYAKDSLQKTEKHDSKRYAWGLATYHYLIEAPWRLQRAEIVRYAGERSVNGQQYDLVFATWGSEAPNKQYDQWLIYINQRTGYIDLTEITIGDFFLPLPKGMQYGTVLYPERTKTAIGALLPTRIIIQIGKPKEAHRDVYTIRFRDYTFDSFDLAELYPLDGLPTYGDAKPAETK